MGSAPPAPSSKCLIPLAHARLSHTTPCSPPSAFWSARAILNTLKMGGPMCTPPCRPAGGGVARKIRHLVSRFFGQLARGTRAQHSGRSRRGAGRTGASAQDAGSERGEMTLPGMHLVGVGFGSTNFFASGAAQPLFDHFAQAAIERVINSLPEGILIALFAWAVLRVLPRRRTPARGLQSGSRRCSRWWPCRWWKGSGLTG